MVKNAFYCSKTVASSRISSDRREGEALICAVLHIPARSRPGTNVDNLGSCSRDDSSGHRLQVNALAGQVRQSSFKRSRAEPHRRQGCTVHSSHTCGPEHVFLFSLGGGFRARPTLLIGKRYSSGCRVCLDSPDIDSLFFRRVPRCT